EGQRVTLLRLEDLLRAARTAQAMGRVRALPVRGIRDLGVGELVVVGRGDVHDAGAARGVYELFERREQLRRAGHVQLPARLHEVDLRVDVPEDASRHGGNDTCVVVGSHARAT